MWRLSLVGLLLALPFVAVPLVWAATNDGGRPSVCAAAERAERFGITGGDPSDAPVRWDAYAHAVPASRLIHNLRHGGVAVQYGAGVPARTVRLLEAWYRRDRVALVVAPLPQLGEELVLSSWSGSARCRTFDAAAFSEFRDQRRFQAPESPPRAELRPARPVEQLRATASRISFVVSAAAAIEVEVQTTAGRPVRTLGHYTVPARQGLVLAWNGRDDAGGRLQRGRYVAVVTASGDRGRHTFRTQFALG